MQARVHGGCFRWRSVIPFLRRGNFLRGACGPETRGKIDTPLKRNAHETRIVQTLPLVLVVFSVLRESMLGTFSDETQRNHSRISKLYENKSN